MKSEQLEIILFKDTQFSSKQFWENRDNNNQNNSGDNGDLEEACWNGLLKEILPELYPLAGDSNDLFLWKIIQTDHFLQLEYGEDPQMEEIHLSLNPYSIPWSQRLS